MTREELLKNTKCRYTGKEVSSNYSNEKEVMEEMNLCSVCGCLYEKENGCDTFEDEEYIYGATCNECIALINQNTSYEDIPYQDESLRLSFCSSIESEYLYGIDNYKCLD